MPLVSISTSPHNFHRTYLSTIILYQLNIIDETRERTVYN